MAALDLVMLGGRPNMMHKYKKIITKNGYNPKIFIRKTQNLGLVIGSPHAIILLRDQVSHEMAKEGRSVAKKEKIPFLICNNSISSLRKSLLTLKNIENDYQVIIL